MRALERRLQVLEGHVRSSSAVGLRLFWDDQVITCAAHIACVVEHSSGVHHPDVISLSFGGKP